MNEDSAPQEFEDRLNEIWEQGHRSMAAAFLRRAVTLDSTLAEVAAALQFDAVRNFRDTLRLRDVIRELQAEASATSPRPRPRPTVVEGPPAALPAASGKRRRKRRGPDQLREVKEHLCALLTKEPGSLDTTQMFEAVGQAGFDIDRLTLNRLLAQLEEEGKATCLGGRPKSWRSQEAEAGEDKS